MDKFERLKQEFERVTPNVQVKIDKHNRITNWDELPPNIKDWIKNG